MQKTHLAFTLVELMIVLAIISILVIVAIPSYRIYTKRAHFIEVVQASGPFKMGVEECYQISGSLAECKSGQNGVPTGIGLGEGAGMVASAQVGDNGVITLVPSQKFGISSQDTYILTPKEEGHQLTWRASGGAVLSGYAK